MSMIDTGGKYENLVTDDDFCDVINRKISPEFALIIRQKITNENDRMDELQSDLEYEAADNAAYFEAMQRIHGAAYDAALTVKKMERVDKKKIIALFDEIKFEASNFL